jgi:hypothetical protein
MNDADLGKTARMIHAAKLAAKHECVTVICNDWMHCRCMEDKYGSWPNLKYLPFDKLSLSNLSTMYMDGAMLFIDHSVIDKHFGDMLKQYHELEHRRSFDQ